MQAIKGKIKNIKKNTPTLLRVQIINVRPDAIYDTNFHRNAPII